MAVEKHRGAPRLQPGDQLPHIAAADRVEVGGRLVQDQQLRPPKDRLRQAQPLLHSLREVAHLAALTRQRAPLQRFGNAAATLTRRQSKQPAEIVEDLVRKEELGEVGLLGSEPDSCSSGHVAWR